MFTIFPTPTVQGPPIVHTNRVLMPKLWIRPTDTWRAAPLALFSLSVLGILCLSAFKDSIAFSNLAKLC